MLPGFVDSHTHPVFTAPRLIDFEKRIAGATYEEIAEAGGGIRASLRGVRDASQQELAAHVVRGLDEMARHGTTTVECKSGYGLNFAAEMKSLEAIREASHQWPGYGGADAAGGARGPAGTPRKSRGVRPHHLRRHDSHRREAETRRLR